MSLLSVKNLSFSYSNKEDVLKDIALSVESGEHIALVGPNGSGKTTLFQLLLGYFTPATGEVLLENREIHRYPVPERARRIAFVPQGGRIEFPYTCLETVLMGLHPHQSRFAPWDEASLDRARELMEETGVWHLAAKSVTEISGGQMQRLLLARALLQIFPDPGSAAAPSRLLLLDETLSELDIAARIAMMKLLSRLVKDRGLTVIGIHHDLNLAYRFTSRIIALNRGRIAADGNPDRVFTPEFFAGVFSVKAEILPCRGFLFYDNMGESP
ncbi:ferric enterobactin transport ATP-binding protein FepC [Treponema primitia ZAS-2]|uniref:Ferric enterobactin transport ATP-binding protein FepC n=1 Tax=Treponema primitia (strain ATCC BAA-887 / DSM 12427 / ZAS-2) TaxID=545694 RepID=F5YLA9_TREPZ|nr:ABC transporter ATP-binding protein [Treponema primitia]AEF85476.1 ferric enterobactin transport ATP-binding protein FepC [Treponema primitia ZAS-2]